VSAALKVLSAGLHTTVQDLGRQGYQAIGVPVSGALDAPSLRLANRLAGNADNTAALEILYQGPTLEVQAARARVALAGGDATLELVGERTRAMGGWRSLLLQQGERFRVSASSGSACCYLAVEGGIAVAPCLGSAATFTRGGFGGFEGRALKSGDLLPLARADVEERTELMLEHPPSAARDQTIRVVLGPQADHFTAAAIARFLGSEFRISKDADRMGARLEGVKLEHSGGYNIASDGIATGAIQVPGSGQAILLLADHQTTGGYPKIATVISADLPVAGRRRPGDAVRFAAIGVAEAESLRRAQEKELQGLMASLAPAAAGTGLDPARLYSVNLISGAVAGDE